jgi:hypothetical protein
MPARSVLLNVSITARGLGKESLVEQVKEVKAQEEKDIVKVEEGNRERVDSATGDVVPSFNPSLSLATSCSTPTAGIASSTFGKYSRAYHFVAYH